MAKLPAYRWNPSPNYYREQVDQHIRVVIHDTEGGYEGAIATFKNPHSEVSAHFVLKEDGSEITQMVPLTRIAWHVKAFNAGSIGVEMAGFAKAGYSDKEWDAAAGVIAWLLHRFNMPCQWAKGLNGKIGAGFCSHYDLGAAGGGHSDPTTSAIVWATFMARVRAAYAAPYDSTQWPGLVL